jgi:hypothetical protein
MAVWYTLLSLAQGLALCGPSCAFRVGCAKTWRQVSRQRVYWVGLKVGDNNENDVVDAAAGEPGLSDLKAGRISAAGLGLPRRAVGVVWAECEHVIKRRREYASKADCRIDAADVDPAERVLSSRSTLGSSVRRWLGESGLIDANLGAHGCDVLNEVARGSPTAHLRRG